MVLNMELTYFKVYVQLKLLIKDVWEHEKKNEEHNANNVLSLNRSRM